MTLIRTTLLNGIAVFIKMLTLLGINKILAIYVGPNGYAAIGQFQNAVQMITTFASGAINTGVTKYTAEYHDDAVKQHRVWRTAGTIALTGSLVTGIIIAIFNESLAIWFLKDANYSGVFLWFAATLVLFTFNTLLLAILNGKKEIRRYVFANIAGSIFALIVTAIMAIKFGLYGALVALAVYQSITFFVTLLLCYKAPWFKINYLFGKIDREMAVNLGKYTAMALTSAACVPVSHILVRNHLGESLGWAAAGHWEAIWRLSAAYLMVVTTTLNVYYLPRLSELTEWSEVRQEIMQGYRLILPVAALSGLFIYLLRDQIIILLFTKEFSSMRDLFAWQMLGDTLKIGSWILAYVMLGKSMFQLFIISEIVFAATFVGLTWLFTESMGLQGVALAHAVTYALYWSVMWFFIFRNLAK
ncbi:MULTISPECIES: O-antigen translocase [unclassified Polaromonas]|uniref:O-antigen translocase n=1 Tax=unclassified Polaromonas TaxID=2638319 RepID=UPI0018CA9BB2|nr:MULTISPECIES: O-antigen translocase [unclassified Polaromonas]MBG6070809.1 PST family polysaccharide transporter [Polaromonas sp. CG_9.7]MBG6112881.1 PST family polysaccharide transporter [Polaromonas sp. CG_9.2]